MSSLPKTVFIGWNYDSVVAYYRAFLPSMALGADHMVWRFTEAQIELLGGLSEHRPRPEDLYGYGAIMRTSDYAISMHMGTQFGLVNRVLVTVGCLGLLWSVVSAAVMYVKRRRPGSAGLPRRPADLGLANRLVLIAVVLGLIYPLWGVSALVVLAVDRFVIRRWSRTRRAFGQREASPSPST